MPEAPNGAHETSQSVAVVEIAQDVDVFMARAKVRELALRMGFERREVEELALCATELGTNIVKHSGRGRLVVESVRDAARGPAMRLIARDRGPPIHDFTLAMRDGYGDRGPIDPSVRRKGIGAGLGSVQRLMHTLEHRVEGEGNVVTALRWLCRGGHR